jgi:Mrp family chromosome partitioning ATPase
MQLLGRVYDRLVIDSPPVLGAAETSALASRADGTLLVVRAGQTDRDAAREALYQLETVGATVIGGVLNDPRGIISHYASHAYRYYAER